MVDWIDQHSGQQGPHVKWSSSRDIRASNVHVVARIPRMLTPVLAEGTPVGNASAPNKATPRTIVIEPRRGPLALNFTELWEGRELLYFLAWREVRVRYK